ncbi:uncharacterized protein LOC108469884 isoform X3 [Gossypium arboreum]|uniref:uncharacterized protein LOC108469884 isoform X3 n=1 Tax=Gossypium arboreum TaxID=29729 RepID=UPI0022F15849|nr:uncharacterized protein LOC108469884 isoform X3 [Gossypium arboreum]
MTFCEEVTDQNLDVWANSLASVPDALCHYYYQYLSSSLKAAEGILCIGFLKRSRQQKEITREQAVQDVELKKLKEENQAKAKERTSSSRVRTVLPNTRFL